VSENRSLSNPGPILLGLGLVVAGVAVILIAIFGSADKFHAPRWVAAAAGGAFLFLGGWTAAAYALGYDPARPQETLPSSLLQLLFFVPGLLLFGAPFHWIAFGRGTVGLPGRIAFGLGAILIDGILVAAVVRLARAKKSRAG
jgi:drug/metabolite transporter (DMT)-like permease